MNFMAKVKYLIGIDEVGRGPLAGPVCLGLALIQIKNKTKIYRKLSGIKDSKKLSEKQRMEWLQTINGLEKKNLIQTETMFGSEKLIDKKGISHVITRVIASVITQGLKNINSPKSQIQILLDGGLKAPKEFENQKTIIKGDEKEKIISVASIVAKIRRDDLMKKYDKKYPNYGFGDHKGYGTKNHILAIKKHGPSQIHRRSFLKNIV